jgi:hypothetical protein
MFHGHGGTAERIDISSPTRFAAGLEQLAVQMKDLSTAGSLVNGHRHSADQGELGLVGVSGLTRNRPRVGPSRRPPVATRPGSRSQYSEHHSDSLCN